MSTKTYFVSDLHLLTRRTLAAKHQHAIEKAASKARRFILGGDIFDFHWSTLNCPGKSVDTAMNWLNDLVSRHSNCEFHFVYGNHDYNQRFMRAMDSYSVGVQNLHTHRYFVRLGSSVYLHGDVADKPRLGHEQLETRRAKYLHDGIQKPWRHTVYDLAIKARLHRVVSKLANPKKTVAHRVAGYLNAIGNGAATGAKHVYFGHTHEPMAGYRYGGMTFHNPGAPLAGVNFRIVEAEDDAD